MSSNKIGDILYIPKALTIKSSYYAIAALSLVAALSWNDAIKATIRRVYQVPKDQALAGFIYAFITTLLLIIVIWMLPDTKKELPKETQEKIKEVETEEKLQKLAVEVDELKKENFRMKKVQQESE